ncbi:cobW-domain-containing protein [Gonapodya prolifera JEL478]|uniref:CobW-domain-containing protein n=1 Tax=Gonapodya prolifera (strain JEL478) TaxID=1344416 RepID=A0A139A1X6_GONPJ|nr:cobW-domain-containing protein [Gonapodya prolifera JEL478]|eukprot:KXS10772.1 cobW-domain-containing protein [Gonapodya prolifera JEL478]
MRIPLLILTGFLGAGKTTLLNDLIRQLPSSELNIVVIENEFASNFGLVEHELDGGLQPAVQARVEEIYEFGFGCVCCSSSWELVRVLGKIAAGQQDKDESEDGIDENGANGTRERGKKVDWVVLETTGLADPGPIVELVTGRPDIAEHFEVARVVTVVDTPLFLGRLAGGGEDVVVSRRQSGSEDEDKPDDRSYKNEAREQVVHADLVILNKMDLVGTVAEADDVERAVAELNPRAERVRARFSEVDVAVLLGASTLGRVGDGGGCAVSKRAHDPDIDHIALFHKGPVTLEGVTELVRGLHRDYPGRILRVKGVLTVPRDGGGGGWDTVVVQGVGARELDVKRSAKEAGEAAESRVTLIGRRMGVLQKSVGEKLQGLGVAMPRYEL